MSEPKSHKNLTKTLDHFNSLLNSKLNKISINNENSNLSNRKGSEITDTSDMFLTEYKEASMLQYSHLYFLRLKLVRAKLTELSKKKWKGVRVCQNILETKGSEPCVIIGNVYKDMPLKPQFLKGVESILGAKKIENFVNEVEDYLVIEDDAGRIRINSVDVPQTFFPSNFVTGIACALYGNLNQKGQFNPMDIEYYQIEYSCPMMKELSIQNKHKHKKNLKDFLSSASGEVFVLTSGLNFGFDSHNGKLVLARTLFLNFIQANLPSLELDANLFSKIKKLFILGNLIFPPEDSDLVEKGSYLKQSLNNRVYKKILQSYDEADNFLNYMSNAIQTYLLPGENDISSSYFPQSRLCEYLFLHSKKTVEKTLHLKSNPLSMLMEDFSYLFTSGQNVDNIRKYSKINENEGLEKNSSLKIMEKTLDWGHLCPSAPDTLRTWPVKRDDPLMLEKIPNVYIVGNQKYFEANVCKYKGDQDKMVRLIAVPRFFETFSFVLFDSGSLNVMEYCFDFFN